MVATASSALPSPVDCRGLWFGVLTLDLILCTRDWIHFRYILRWSHIFDLRAYNVTGDVSGGVSLKSVKQSQQCLCWKG